MFDVKDDIRLAGEVTRYHTWPSIRQQSVGEHSWQVARIIMAIAPRYCYVLLPYAIIHDIGELVVGDIPYPVKAQNKELSNIFGELENKALVEICDNWMLPKFSPLTDTEKWVFKLAEFIEMWEWGGEEENLGNSYARKVSKACSDAINKMSNAPLDLEVRTNVIAYTALRQMNWGKGDE